jgi:rhodanese-related sulfurtransferase
VRSLSGAAVLSAAGFPNVASLAGGIDRWSLVVDPTVPRY